MEKSLAGHVILQKKRAGRLLELMTLAVHDCKRVWIPLNLMGGPFDLKYLHQG